MISPKDVSDALEAFLNEKFPGEPVVRDLTPEDFARPCNSVECVKFSAEGAGGGNIQVKMLHAVRTFVPVDAYHQSSFDLLAWRAMRILGLCARGYLNVSDPDTHQRRAVKITGGVCPETNPDSAEVQFTSTLFLSLEEIDGAACPAPLMEKVTISGTNFQEVE